VIAVVEPDADELARVIDGGVQATLLAAWLTGSHLPALVASTMVASMSWVADPPSRKPRVL
jgi:hypothetical protein